VDDREDARYAIRSVLLGMDALVVAEASSGDEAIARIRAERPDLVILDLGLPDMTGFQVLDRLKADVNCRDIPVVIHTSKSLDDSERGLLSGRVAAVLDKSTLARGDTASLLRDCLAKLDPGGVRGPGTEPIR
jgi:CheY-like chemotaxis protein